MHDGRTLQCMSDQTETYFGQTPVLVETCLIPDSLFQVLCRYLFVITFNLYLFLFLQALAELPTG